MKRIVLACLLVCSTLTLTSFGIVDNPKVAAQHRKNISKFAFNVNKEVSFGKRLTHSQFEVKNEIKEEPSSKSLFRTFFGLVYKAISQVVYALISK